MIINRSAFGRRFFFAFLILGLVGSTGAAMKMQSEAPITVKIKLLGPDGEPVEGIKVVLNEFRLDTPKQGGDGKKRGGKGGGQKLTYDATFLTPDEWESAEHRSPVMFQTKAQGQSDEDGILEVRLKPSIYRWKAGERARGKMFASGMLRVEEKTKDKVHEFKLRQF